MTEPQHPPDPIQGIREAAIGLHEAWRSFVDAGFSESQALYLTGQVIVSQLGKPT